MPSKTETYMIQITTGRQVTTFQVEAPSFAAAVKAAKRAWCAANNASRMPSGAGAKAAPATQGEAKRDRQAANPTDWL